MMLFQNLLATILIKFRPNKIILTIINAKQISKDINQRRLDIEQELKVNCKMRIINFNML